MPFHQRRFLLKNGKTNEELRIKNAIKIKE